MKAKSMMYGTFVLGTSEFAVEVEAVTEVVNYPAQIIPVPLAPNYVTGLFNLRGTLIPIFDLGTRLGINSEVDFETTRKIAVLEVDGLRVGMVFDTTREIIKIASDQIISYSYAEGSATPVVRGALSLENGQRIIHLIYMPELVKIENLPHVIEAQKIESERFRMEAKTELSRKQVISFKVGLHLLAADIGCITEIISLPEVDRTVLASEVCMGKIDYRTSVLPLVSLQHLLGHQTDILPEPEDIDDIVLKKILVLKLHGRQIGLVVDTLERIVTYSESDVKAVPLFSRDRKGFLVGCLARENSEELLILDHESLLKDQELQAITEGHSQLYDETSVSDRSGPLKSSVWERFITFTLSHKAAIKMLEIREIVGMPAKLTKAPGATPWVKGLLNLRGDLVSVIDLRTLYGLPEMTHEEPGQVLIVKGEHDIYGLVVDSVDGILTVNQGKKMQIPASFYPSVGDSMLSDLKEFIDPYGEFPIKEKIMIFDIEAMLKRVSDVRPAA